MEIQNQNHLTMVRILGIAAVVTLDGQSVELQKGTQSASKVRKDGRGKTRCRCRACKRRTELFDADGIMQLSTQGIDNDVVVAQLFAGSSVKGS